MHGKHVNTGISFKQGIFTTIPCVLCCPYLSVFVLFLSRIVPEVVHKRRGDQIKPKEIKPKETTQQWSRCSGHQWGSTWNHPKPTPVSPAKRMFQGPDPAMGPIQSQNLPQKRGGQGQDRNTGHRWNRTATEPEPGTAQPMGPVPFRICPRILRRSPYRTHAALQRSPLGYQAGTVWPEKGVFKAWNLVGTVSELTGMAVPRTNGHGPLLRFTYGSLNRWLVHR